MGLTGLGDGKSVSIAKDCDPQKSLLITLIKSKAILPDVQYVLNYTSVIEHYYTMSWD